MTFKGAVGDGFGAGSLRWLCETARTSGARGIALQVCPLTQPEHQTYMTPSLSFVLEVGSVVDGCLESTAMPATTRCGVGASVAALADPSRELVPRFTLVRGPRCTDARAPFL